MYEIDESGGNQDLFHGPPKMVSGFERLMTRGNLKREWGFPLSNAQYSTGTVERTRFSSEEECVLVVTVCYKDEPACGRMEL